MAVNLTGRELDGALSYVEGTTASDFFPQPFEISAIRHSWSKVRPILEGIDLASYTPQPAYEVIASKQKYGFRPVHLLDPLDTLLYTGLVLRIAPAIEKNRKRLRGKRTFSFYFQSERMGTDKTFESDWERYRQVVSMKSSANRFVATADIVDFFPRIYQHRLENAISALSSDNAAASALAHMTMTWSRGASYGIPVGVHASNYLAEALLVEVDEYLISRKVDFVRYADDYTIFGKHPSHCLEAIYLLSSRLHESQGLSLNMAKTRVRGADEFRADLIEPQDAVRALQQKVVDEILQGDPYAHVDYAELSDEDRGLIDTVNLEALLDEALRPDLIDIRTVRFVLNILSAFERPALVDLVLENLDKLLPVSESVARFLNVFDKVERKVRISIAERVLKHMRSARFLPEYQSIWLLNPFAESGSWDHLPQLRRLAHHNEEFVKRQAILALGQLGDRSSLLDLKTQVEGAKTWERRAIVFACRKLPKDERDYFYKYLKARWEFPTLTERAVIEFAKIV